MRIQNKLFSVLIVFATVLVVSLVSLMKWSLDKGMIEYVNQREISELRPFMQQLAIIYQQNSSWESLRGADRDFDFMLREALLNSDFALPPHSAGMPRFRSELGQAPRFHEKKRFERRSVYGESDHRKESKIPPQEQKQARRQGHPQHRPYNGQAHPRSGQPPKKPMGKAEGIPHPMSNNVQTDNLRAPVRKHAVSYALLDANKNYVVGYFPKEREYSYTPLKINQQVIGFMAISKRNRLAQGYEFDFVEQQKNYLWYISAAVMLLVMMITYPFARHIISPIRTFTKGMRQLTQGQYKSHISIERKDEFSQLSRDFNELAKTLMENESARKRWLANISHELRTPVAILKGELEAVIDGVRELSLEHVHSAHQEVTHLQRLISDLHALTSADIGGMSYRKQTIDVVVFLDQQVEKLGSYLAQKGFTLEKEIPHDKAMIFADQTRLCQLLENLINNCIKYAESGTIVRLSLQIYHLDKKIKIIVEDDGVGVEDKHLALLFEHLYRVEGSRNRATGGSGLGLSICAHIVQAHQGEIYAEKSHLGGLAIHICLPLQ
ncbi:ATP-binding protein [Colwellia sp. 1_MG-2023]|uniref:ATP-binding protein n=1 Tax=Colwellia sp. 1_MG-2023 TaxID=3062649 RepID=UPI0026E1CA7E|nr:ATP-binding protein [Colwellia sp. 1_MG-2023]MDO6444239.1 ATP-binding protein [Colwellia sp. 1_MG-2023]